MTADRVGPHSAVRRNVTDRIPRALFVAVLLIGLWPIEGRAQQGGVELLAPEMLFAQGWRFSLTALRREDRDLYDGTQTVSDALGQRFTEHAVVLGIDYGIRHDFSLSALVPYVHRELRVFDGTRHRHLTAEGLGDVVLMAKYLAWKRHWRRGAAHWAVVGGVELPTGEARETRDGVRLPSKVQPGRGAWTPIVASSVNLEMDRTRFDLVGLIKLNQEGTSDLRKGNQYSLEFDAGYRWYHAQYPGPSHSVKIGILWRHESRSRQNGSDVANSGSDVLILRPGLTFHFTPGTTIKVSYDWPIYRHYHGQQLGYEERFAVAFGIRF
ncbi:MAG: transporter [Planctomycetota bacterium]